MYYVEEDPLYHKMRDNCNNNNEVQNLLVKNVNFHR